VGRRLKSEIRPIHDEHIAGADVVQPLNRLDDVADDSRNLTVAPGMWRPTL
jgi:hypothetical protein